MQTLTVVMSNTVAVVASLIVSVVAISFFIIADRYWSRNRRKQYSASNIFDVLAFKDTALEFINNLTNSSTKIESSIEELKACQYELLHSIIDDKTPQKTAGEALTLTDYEPFGIYCYAWYTGTFWRVTCQLVTNTVSSRKADRVDLPGEFNSRAEAEQKALLFAESLHSSGIQKPIVETVNNQ